VWERDADILAFLRLALCRRSLAETLHILIDEAFRDLTPSQRKMVMLAAQDSRKKARGV
jgi:hypothetical protein